MKQRNNIKFKEEIRCRQANFFCFFALHFEEPAPLGANFASQHVGTNFALLAFYKFKKLVSLRCASLFQKNLLIFLERKSNGASVVFLLLKKNETSEHLL